MKETCVLFFFSALFIYGQPVHAQSGILLNPAILYYSYHDKDAGSDIQKVQTQSGEFKLGLLTESGLYVGGLYSQMKRVDGDLRRQRNSYGPGAGWYYSRFFIATHYLLKSEFAISTSSTLQKGKGLQYEISYWFNLSGSVYIGPQLVYRKIEYDKKDGVGVKDTSSVETLPYLSMAFIF